MPEHRRQRTWFLIAAIAIGVALVFLLVPLHSADQGHFVAILPLIFAGIISPLSLLAPLAFEYCSRRPQAPVLPARFQRPPPFLLA